MRDARLIRHCVVLSLPAAALVAFGAFFLVSVVPHIEENERARTRGEARDVAERLKDGEAAPDFAWIYEKGVEGGGRWSEAFPATMTWKAWDQQGQVGKSPWGWRDVGGRRVVWVRADKSTVLGVETAIAETDYATWLWTTCTILLAALLASTVFAIRRLHSYAKTRDDFLAAAAHDLTTPLVGMRYLIGSDDDEARNMNERMLRLVGNIRDFLDLGGRRRKPAREPFCVRDAFDAAYRLFAADYEEESSGPVEVSGDRSLAVRADRELVELVLWNLLGNDLKYAAPFGPVEARFRREGEWAVVEIADEGQGMSPRQMKRAFDRYWRAKTVLKSGKGGFGIGLCTSREYARAMGGDLSVASNSPKGCVFTLRLPSQGM